MHVGKALSLGAAVAGVGTVGYAAGVELTSFRLRRFTVPVLRAGEDPVRVLQLSDAHLTPRQGKKQAWVRELARFCPDLVVNTGDTIAHPDVVPFALEMLEPLFAFPGVFVFGSNDYYAPRPKNPARYLWESESPRIFGHPLPWPQLRDGMVEAGWLDLSNRRDRVKVGGLDVEVAGVDDPHINRDKYAEVAGPVDVAADLHIGVTHSPEPRVLDAMATDGFSLLLAGHTHGGQLRVPLYGALVTNCGLDRSRARGLSRYAGAWLHVSAGLGTSPYAPVRFACPPEATLLTLVPGR
jgi:predicted MPP superfamily phosphohydrolase